MCYIHSLHCLGVAPHWKPGGMVKTSLTGRWGWVVPGQVAYHPFLQGAERGPRAAFLALTSLGQADTEVLTLNIPL